MDIGNDVDLSNNNITPLWRRCPDNGNSRQGSSKPKSRPHSYHMNGVMTTDFPVEDNGCPFTLSQPAERLVVASPCSDRNPTVLKHILHKPSRKTRVGKTTNGDSIWPEKHPKVLRKCVSGSLAVNSQIDQIAFGTNSSSLDSVSVDRSSPVFPQRTPNNGNHCELSSLSSTSSSSPPTRRTLTPSHSSNSSILSLSSLTSSDPPTPRSPSPADRGQPLLRQSQMYTPPSSQDARHVSSSSSVSSLSPTPSFSPSISPSPSIVLSTHSPAALKMGTQQIIPKGLASDVRLTKTAASGTQGQGLRAAKAISMVETGAYFSTGGGHGVETEGESEGTGMLRRGLRSTSYRRAVVSGVELEVPTLDPRTLQLSQLDIKGSDMDNLTSSGNRKKVLTSQRTFDSEEEELYQNYQEKALHNDSDEDPDAQEAKPDDGIVVQYRPIRTSWSQLSVVKKSGLSDLISQEERKRQEAIFEVISSEHSYLHSLEILIRMFKNSAELSDAMTKTEHHHLFSNITDVCEASKKFFKELEERHQQNIVIDDISDIVCKHAQSNFDPYVTYCSNEVYQQRTLQRLVSKNPAFKDVLTRIEGHPDCRNLPMISFLILPMQRITRLPLLMDTICQKTPKDSAQYEECTRALQAVSKVVRKCNEGARTMERTEMMYTINSQLDFKIKPFPLVSSSRWMVKRGELTALVEDNGIFLKRTSRQQVYFFLFNDVLIVTRKKSEESYSVIDYALRDQIWVGSCQPEDINLSPVRTTASMLSSRQPGANHLFRLCFRSNHSDEKVPMILGAELLNERARWISALGHNVNNEKNQDRTNAMQVEVIRTYTAKQPDELSLQVADVVLVSQTVDGWYEGERLRDGERGWFLTECAEPITCQATIERNMQRLDRLQGLETNV
uniref:Rho guanine nucleotide exchange factor 26 n=1 Tax=Salarias fasciatus TaxID=181472 RepID=A0A672GL12_SALFA